MCVCVCMAFTQHLERIIHSSLHASTAWQTEEARSETTSICKCQWFRFYYTMMIFIIALHLYALFEKREKYIPSWCYHRRHLEKWDIKICDGMKIIRRNMLRLEKYIEKQLCLNQFARVANDDVTDTFMVFFWYTVEIDGYQ